MIASALYAGTLVNGFVFDDLPQVVGNPWLRDPSHLGEIFGSDVWAFAGRESNYYRPLMHVIYLMVYLASGPSPVAFHLVNLLVHALCTAAVFALIVRVLAPTPGMVSAAVGPGALGALVFAAHPVHVEAVAWVSGLPDLGMAAFYLAALIAYLEPPTATDRSLAAHGMGALCFLCAALLKEPGITLPAVVIAIDAARRPVDRPLRFWLIRYGTLATAAGIYAYLRLNALGGVAPHASTSAFGVADALGFVGTAMWRYVEMLVYPHPLNMFQTLATAPPWPTWIPLGLLPLGIAFAIARRNVPWTAMLSLFVIPLAPALYAPAILPGLDNPWAERYAYLPSVGLAMAVAIAMHGTRTHTVARRAIIVAGVVVAVVFSTMTVRRVPVWKDDLTLWTDTVAKSPYAGAARGALGYAHFVRGDLDRAIDEYRAAIALKPDHADSHLNLGVAMAMKGLHADAAMAYERAIQLQPRNGQAYANLALALSALGRNTDALTVARRGVALAPQRALAHHALGVALGNAGRIAEAADAFRSAVAIDPGDAQSKANLAQAEALLRAR